MAIYLSAHDSKASLGDHLTDVSPLRMWLPALVVVSATIIILKM